MLIREPQKGRGKKERDASVAAGGQRKTFALEGKKGDKVRTSFPFCHEQRERQELDGAN